MESARDRQAHQARSRALVLVLALLLPSALSCHQPLMDLRVPETAQSTPYRARFDTYEFTLSRRAARVVNELTQAGTLLIDTQAVFRWNAVRALKTPDGVCHAMLVGSLHNGPNWFNVQLRSSTVIGSVMFAHREASPFIAVRIPGQPHWQWWVAPDADTCTKFFVPSNVTNETISLVEVGQTVGCTGRPFPLSLATIYRSMRACQNPGSAPDFDELQYAGAEPIPAELLARRPLWPSDRLHTHSPDASVAIATDASSP